jgi:hypothetical protein
MMRKKLFVGLMAIGSIGFGASLELPPGWNLMGNGDELMVLDNQTFGNETSNIKILWKWDAKQRKWVVWSPRKNILKILEAYHKKHPEIIGGITQTIEPYAGFWVYVDKQSKINVNSPVDTIINEIPKKELDDKEKEDLFHMREEEKLARDVYLTLYKKWGIRIFRNIARSEQRHMDAIKELLNKYNLPDPVETVGGKIGEFKDEKLQDLYNQLVQQGEESVVEALKVGATIEDLDIKDLEEALNRTDNEDIKIVYQNLIKGSQHHLKAFTKLLSYYNETYECQYITQEECQQIINSYHQGGYGQHQGGNGHHQGGNGHHQGGYGQQQGGNGQHQGGYGQNQGGNGQQQGGNGQHQGGNGQHQGGYGQHQGGNGQHQGGNGQHQGGNGQHQGGYGQQQGNKK